MRVIPAVGLIALLVATACQSAPSQGSQSPSAIAQPSSWTTFLRDPQRSGSGATAPRIGSPTLVWTSPAVDGDIYAEPLVYGGSVYIATENDSVYAVAASDGHIRWMRHLGAAVPAAQLPCGNISIVGITSTPVIDVAGQTIYAVGLVEPSVYHLFGLDLGSGNIKVDSLLDLGSLDPKVEGQRGALTLSAGRLLIPFGGRNGDCGAYHGLLLTVPVGGSGTPKLYRVPSGRAAGIWAPGGVTVDSSGQIWAATGNSFSTSSYDYANSVIRLSVDMAPQDSWAPKDWLQLNDNDLDIGSVSPALIGDSLVFQSGKNGFGYLLDRAHLGGIGGELFSGRVCESAYGSPIYARPFVYVPCFDGLYALRVDESGRSFSTAWHSPQIRSGSPIIAFGAVWVMDYERGILLAMDPVSGHAIWDRALGQAAAHFATPSAGGSCVLAASQSHVTAVSAIGIKC